MTAKQRVLLKHPKAVRNSAGYIQIPTGPGWAKVIGKSWADAAKSLRPRARGKA